VGREQLQDSVGRPVVHPCLDVTHDRGGHECCGAGPTRAPGGQKVLDVMSSSASIWRILVLNRKNT
jgi:hypothetical protein